MYVLTLAGADVALEVSDATRRELTLEMQWFGADRLARLLGVLGDLSAELKSPRTRAYRSRSRSRAWCAPIRT